MKIEIIGPKPFIESLQAMMQVDPESTVLSVNPKRDDAEFKLSVEEIAALLGIVIGLKDLVKFVIDIIKSSKTKNTIKVKTPLGTAVLNVDEKTSIKDVENMLKPFFPKKK